VKDQADSPAMAASVMLAHPCIPPPSGRNQLVWAKLRAVEAAKSWQPHQTAFRLYIDVCSGSKADIPPGYRHETRKDATWLRTKMRVRVKTFRTEELARRATVTALL
jgi:hypothetical protein